MIRIYFLCFSPQTPETKFLTYTVPTYSSQENIVTDVYITSLPQPFFFQILKNDEEIGTHSLGWGAISNLQLPNYLWPWLAEAFISNKIPKDSNIQQTPMWKPQILRISAFTRYIS